MNTRPCGINSSRAARLTAAACGLKIRTTALRAQFGVLLNTTGGPKTQDAPASCVLNGSGRCQPGLSFDEGKEISVEMAWNERLEPQAGSLTKQLPGQTGNWHACRNVWKNASSMIN